MLFCIQVSSLRGVGFFFFLQVKRGDYPVLGAKVEVTASHPASNGSNLHKEKFELLDTGSGGEWVL
jgi:hypothetical protein